MAATSLSRIHTAKTIWREANRDLRVDGVQQFEKFNIINRAILITVTPFYGLMERAYSTPLSVVVGTATSIALDALQIMRTGENISFSLESDQTKHVTFYTEDAFANWKSDDFHNQKRIACCYIGEKIKIQFGTGLSTAGNCILYYPRVPYSLADDVTFADVPDGAATNLLILMTKKLIVERYVGVRPALPQESVEQAVKDLYSSFNFRATTELVKEKVSALI